VFLERWRRDRWDPGYPRRRRSRRLLTRLLLVIGALGVLVGAPAAFVRTRCYTSDRPTHALASHPAPAAAQIRGYSRDGARTYLSFPEWYIVYTIEEHAAYSERERPSGFPYFGSITQYWTTYGAVCGATRGVYPFDGGSHLMLAAIGVTFTVEYTLKGLYENSVGRLTEWVGTNDTEEDRWARRTEREYSAFMRHSAWYSFPFWSRLTALWRETPLLGEHRTRKWERRLALSLEYSVKSVYSWMIGQPAASVSAPQDLRTYARVRERPGAPISEPDTKRIAVLDDGTAIVALPRYEAFTPAALKLAGKGVGFVDVAGNERMLVTVLAPAGQLPTFPPEVRMLFRVPVLTRPERERVALDAPVASLPSLAADLRKRRIDIEHLYDY
jgi:hypothetical protein